MKIKETRLLMFLMSFSFCQSYVHRSGRTARASKEGLSVMLIESGEIQQYRNLCRTLNRGKIYFIESI